MTRPSTKANKLHRAAAHASSTTVSRGLPLCLRYACVHIGTLKVSINSSTRSQLHTILWAFGVTDASEHEVLGIWTMSADGLDSAELMVQDMGARGLECVSMLLNDAPVEVAAAVLAAYPEALLLELSTSVAHADQATVMFPGRAALSGHPSAQWSSAANEESLAPSYEDGEGGYGTAQAATRWRAKPGRSQDAVPLRPRVQLAALRANEIARHLQRAVSAVLGRRTFASLEAAAECAEAWLVAAERRLRTGGAAEAAGQSSADRLRRPVEAGAHR